MHSAIRHGSRLIEVSYFIHLPGLKDDMSNIDELETKDGWSVSIYDGYTSTAWRDLCSGNQIIAENAADAERQALTWAETIEIPA